MHPGIFRAGNLCTSEALRLTDARIIWLSGQPLSRAKSRFAWRSSPSFVLSAVP